MSIKIILADDQQIVRDGLRSLLQEQRGIEIVAEAEDGRSCVKLAGQFQPDIIIMDISMPGLNGIEATRQILARSDRIRVIALSMHSDRRFITEALNAGASG